MRGAMWELVLRGIASGNYSGDKDPISTARCSGKPPHAGSILLAAVAGWLSGNSPFAPCLRLSASESWVLSGTTVYCHVLPWTYIVCQRSSPLARRFGFDGYIQKLLKLSLL